MIKQKIKNYVLGVCRASHEASKLSRTCLLYTSDAADE